MDVTETCDRVDLGRAFGGVDQDRIRSLRRLLADHGFDAVVCGIPKNVLMVSGYWPVVGKSLAVVSKDGGIGVVYPQDEEDLASRSWADAVESYEPATLERTPTLTEAMTAPFQRVMSVLGEGGRIGIEAMHDSSPTPYVALNLFLDTLRRLIRSVAPRAVVASADDLLDRAAAVKSPREIDRIESAIAPAKAAYDVAISQLRPGLREVDVAATLRTPLATMGVGRNGIQRADGYAFCMSGPNSAKAFAAYQRSRDRVIREGDVALLHVNSYADGFWTDLTRTVCVGSNPPAERVLRVIQDARTAALETIRPGVPARAADRAARRVIELEGFGGAFRHGLGHGVGFEAIDPEACPRLHPTSIDVFEEGMVFNVEPGIYLDGEFGARHCDMVAVTGDGCRVLSMF